MSLIVLQGIPPDNANAERCGSGAAESGSDAGADAVSRRLQPVVRLGAPRHPADQTPPLGTDEAARGPTAPDTASGLPAGVGRRYADHLLPGLRGSGPRCGLLSQ